VELPLSTFEGQSSIMSGSIEVIPDTITGSPTERVKEPVN